MSMSGNHGEYYDDITTDSERDARAQRVRALMNADRSTRFAADGDPLVTARPAPDQPYRAVVDEVTYPNGKITVTMDFHPEPTDAERLGNSITPKSLRETLCVAQTALGVMGDITGIKRAAIEHHASMLQRLINQLDELRPLGPDGKHGDGERCTLSCGCEGRTRTWSLTP